MPNKPSLSWAQQVDLLKSRSLDVADDAGCVKFLASQNYYRFSGYARYFQRAPHYSDDTFQLGTTFDEIRAIYDSDEALRARLARQLTAAEIVLRSHTAHVIANLHGAYGRYLEEDSYSDIENHEPTVESCLRDIERSKELHILRFKTGQPRASFFDELPWCSAVEAWSFGTLSKCIERGDTGSLADAVATSLGVANAGFAYRVRALVYLRNRCAHHGRLWNHSVVDAGPTPNNVRAKAKRIAGQFEPRSVIDVIASLHDILTRSSGVAPCCPIW